MPINCGMQCDWKCFSDMLMRVFGFISRLGCSTSFALSVLRKPLMQVDHIINRRVAMVRMAVLAGCG